MIVYKFGGASVSSVSSIEKLAGIVSDCNNDLVVVISAFGKTTNALEELLARWYEGSNERYIIYDQLKNYHHDIISQLFTSSNHPVYKEFADLFSALRTRLDIRPADNYDFEYDQLVSLGEIISTKIISAFLNSRNIANRWIDAREWLSTDNTFREANVDFAETRANLSQLIRGEPSVWITQGFIGGTKDGYTTTLGREGSDYTASVVANIMDAVRLTVWKDVPGILTADPVFFPEAEKLDQLSYQEAIELSFYGAKVIHPKTIKPLQNRNIPLLVKSFVDPGGSGTLIHGTGSPADIKPILIIKEDQMLVSLTPRDFSFVVEDYLSRIFALFFKYHMKVNLIQHSAISFTICMDDKGPFVEQLLSEMRSDFRVLYNKGLELITIRHYTSAVIERYAGKKVVLVEQRSRSTVMFVVR